MKVTVNKTKKFSYVILDDVYNKEALNDIWKEAEFLSVPRKLNPPDKTGQSAFAKNGKRMKSNKGIWLEETYRDRKVSNFLFHQDKLLDKKFVSYLQEQDFHFNAFGVVNTSSTLLNYYEDSDYYYPHQDFAVLTAVYWLFKEPKQFDGGNLKLNDIDAEVEVKSNRGIIFPSYARHEVTPIKMHDGIAKNENNGRFSFSTFFVSTNMMERETIIE